MKFIKTTDDCYINSDKIDSFTVIKQFVPGKKFAHYSVIAHRESQYWSLKEFVCYPDDETQFDPKVEAQAWLDKLVSKINGEDRTNRAKLIEVAARVRSIAEDVRMSENSNDNYGYYCQLCDAADDIEIIADED